MVVVGGETKWHSQSCFGGRYRHSEREERIPMILSRRPRERERVPKSVPEDEHRTNNDQWSRNGIPHGGSQRFGPDNLDQSINDRCLSFFPRAPNRTRRSYFVPLGRLEYFEPCVLCFVGFPQQSTLIGCLRERESEREKADSEPSKLRIREDTHHPSSVGGSLNANDKRKTTNKRGKTMNQQNKQSKAKKQTNQRTNQRTNERAKRTHTQRIRASQTYADRLCRDIPGSHFRENIRGR